MRKTRNSLLLAGSLAALFGMGVPARPAEAQVKVQFRFGTVDRPIQGRYYQNMRALARYLDEQAWEASNAANEQVAYSPRTQAVIANINEFADRASQFHERMDAYVNRPWDVQREVIALDQQSQRVNRLIRRGRVYSNVFEQWTNVVQALELMKQSLNGVEVRVPPSHRRFGDHDRGDAGLVGVISGVLGGDRDRDRREAGNYNPGYPATNPPSSGYAGGARPLAGRELDEFRNLSRDLDQTLPRVVETAGRYQGQRSFDENVYSGLRQLSSEANGLSQNVGQGQVDPSRWLPTVQRMLNDATNLEQSLRSSGTMPSVLPDLWKARQVLDRMVQILK